MRAWRLARRRGHIRGRGSGSRLARRRTAQARGLPPARAARFLIQPTSTNANTAHKTPAPATRAIIFRLLRHKASQA
ncbi:hypothetical protein G6F68_021160 [Rhizopus microsporus]|nr:hypothetical protein G6F68_021160 [Rhizopus microsporus]